MRFVFGGWHPGHTTQIEVTELRLRWQRLVWCLGRLTVMTRTHNYVMRANKRAIKSLGPTRATGEEFNRQSRRPPLDCHISTDQVCIIFTVADSNEIPHETAFSRTVLLHQYLKRDKLHFSTVPYTLAFVRTARLSHRSDTYSSQLDIPDDHLMSSKLRILMTVIHEVTGWLIR